MHELLHEWYDQYQPLCRDVKKTVLYKGSVPVTARQYTLPENWHRDLVTSVPTLSVVMSKGLTEALSRPPLTSDRTQPGRNAAILLDDRKEKDGLDLAVCDQTGNCCVLVPQVDRVVLLVSPNLPLGTLVSRTR